MDQGVALRVARLIRPHLPDLLGDEAGEVDGELARLLQRSEEGHAVVPDVVRVLHRHEATREWVANCLFAGVASDRGFEPVPGSVQYIPPSRWTCPHFAECGTEFFRYSVGEPVPLCPEHHVELVQVAE
jgi:hypothetical protein